MSDHVDHHLATLYERIAHLSGIVERTHRPGPVTDVDYSDATKPRIRIQIGTDDQGQPVKGPWVPVVSHAGARVIHAPVTVGQTMLQLAPDGNFENAVAMHYGFSSKTKSPSTDKDTHVDQLGKSVDTLKDGSRKIEVENASIALTKGQIVITAGGSSWTITDGKILEKAGTIALVGDIALGDEGASRPLALQNSFDTRGDQQVGNLATKVKGV